MRLVCPYFKDNRCVSRYHSQLKLRLSISAICATQEYINCPIYIETIKREGEEKKKDI